MYNIIMKKILIKITTSVATILLPIAVFASSPEKVGILQFNIDNPLRVNNFWDLLLLIIDIALKIGIPIAVGFFIWAGFQYIFAGGNDAKIKIATKNLKNVVLGTVLFLGAWTITQVIVKTIQSVVGTQ